MLRALEDGVLAPSPGDDRPLGAVVPVPTTPKRLRERGFNPARVLADGVGQALDIPVLEALSRPAEAPRQVGLPPSRRAANVRGAFIAEAGRRDPLLPPYVLLVDDVLTTGATGAAAAESLARAGVARVGFLTFARALPGDPGS
jgi:predicted amidophosphoribosyltransferase